MKQLQSAARAQGLNLVGALLKKDPRSIDRPMIVFLKQGIHGHFIVVRPVGRTGGIIQIFDPNGPVRVVDKSDLFSGSEWSGLAPIPDRPNWLSRIGWGLGAVAVVAGFGAWLTARRRRRSMRSPSANLCSTATHAAEAKSEVVSEEVATLLRMPNSATGRTMSL